MNHPDFSAYTRRKLASTGPFLTDDDRDFVAMSLRDAIEHLIVECDTNVIPCSILEFLIRTTFAWKFLRDKDAGLIETFAVKKFEDDDNEPFADMPDDFTELCFYEPVFERGMSAQDFQTELQQICNMQIDEVQLMLENFLDARAQRPRRRPGQHESAPTSQVLALEAITDGG